MITDTQRNVFFDCLVTEKGKTDDGFGFVNLTRSYILEWFL